MESEAAIELSVSDFVGLLNQTLDYAYPNVTIVGELANFRVSKNRWVYFDLKDDMSSVKFFGTIYQLPGPLEDGMLLKVRGQPRLHNLYGFSVNVVSMQPAGEGSIKKAAELLQLKLSSEGLFDDARKRPLPYPPKRIGLVASKQSAAYADFIKILNARWGGVSVQHIDVQVQGEVAPAQIVAAIEHFNAQAEPPEVLVVIRGGGSTEDLAAFSTEQVTRAMAGSRVPTLVAIGHEIDLSLAELAADRRASTPSNAAEFLVPDRDHVAVQLKSTASQLEHLGQLRISSAQDELQAVSGEIARLVEHAFERARHELTSNRQLLIALSPESILKRGYAIVRQGGGALRSIKEVKNGIVDIQLADGTFTAQAQKKGTA